MSLVRLEPSVAAVRILAVHHGAVIGVLVLLALRRITARLRPSERGRVRVLQHVSNRPFLLFCLGGVAEFQVPRSRSGRLCLVLHPARRARGALSFCRRATLPRRWNAREIGFKIRMFTDGVPGIFPAHAALAYSFVRAVEFVSSGATSCQPATTFRHLSRLRRGDVQMAAFNRELLRQAQGIQTHRNARLQDRSELRLPRARLLGEQRLTWRL